MPFITHENICQNCGKKYKWSYNWSKGQTSVAIIRPDVIQATRFGHNRSLNQEYLNLIARCPHCTSNQYFRYHYDTDSVESILPESVE